VLTAREGAAGEITIDVRFPAAALTVSVAVPFRVPDWAVIVADPDAEAVATPLALMLATLVSDDPHCTELVTSLLLPSENCALAVNCCVAPMPTEEEFGDT
jgi:hypothetical protein